MSVSKETFPATQIVRPLHTLITHYILQALDWMEPLASALGAGVGFWAFRRCRKVGYLLVALYFCFGVFSLVALPRIKAAMDARRTPTLSEATQQKINAAVREAIDRVVREEGAQPGVAERNIRFPLGPLVLVLGVWLLARRETRTDRGNVIAGAPKNEETTA